MHHLDLSLLCIFSPALSSCLLFWFVLLCFCLFTKMSSAIFSNSSVEFISAMRCLASKSSSVFTHTQFFFFFRDFWHGPFLKSIEFVPNFCNKFASVLCFGVLAARHLGFYSPSGDWTLTPYTGRGGFNHWTTREYPFPLPFQTSILYFISWRHCGLSEVFFCSLTLDLSCSVGAFSLLGSLERVCCLPRGWRPGSQGWERGTWKALTSLRPSAGPTGIPEPCLLSFARVWTLWAVILVRFWRIEIIILFQNPLESQY